MSIVSERLSAVRKLQENPNDVSAKMILNQAQKQVHDQHNNFFGWPLTYTVNLCVKTFGHLTNSVKLQCSRKRQIC